MAEPQQTGKTLDERIEQVHVEVGEHFVELHDFISYNFTKVRQEIGGLRQEIGAVSQEVGGLRQEIGAVSQEVGGLRQEVGGLRQEIGAVRQEVGGLRQEFGAVRQEVGALRQDMTTGFARTELRFERLESKLDRVLSTRPPRSRRPKRGR